MNKHKYLIFAFLMTATSSGLAQQQAQHEPDHEHRGQHQGSGGAGEAGHSGGGKMMMSRVRHHFARDNGIAESYQGKASPLDASEIDMSKAQTLYEENCNSCHGAEGVGDGVLASTLDPAPTNIARFAKMHMAKDDYMLWTISEGGAPVGSTMPAFKDSLTPDEIWQIVGYLRQL